MIFFSKVSPIRNSVYQTFRKKKLPVEAAQKKLEKLEQD